MKKLMSATAIAALFTGAAYAQDMPSEVKIGIALAFTGPLESLAPPMEAGALLAVEEINASGALFDGAQIETVSGDSTCVDAGAATATAERLVTAERVDALMGAMCSGATGAVVANVSVPNGMVTISPSATSPALSTIEDNGLFYRLAPSDARQGAIMADIVMERGFSEVAVSYTNNDYGKGLADAFQAAFEEKGGTVTINAAHEEAKADYSAEVGALASAGGEVLVLVGYADGGGSGIIRAALDTGAFDTFVLPDGMVSDVLTDTFGSELDGSFGQNPQGQGGDEFFAAAEAAGFDGTSPYAGESYDIIALFALAMQAAGSTDPADYNEYIMQIANGPGEVIRYGEIAKGLEIIKNGGTVDYEGASSVTLIGPGEAAGSYREIEIVDGEISEVGFR